MKVGDIERAHALIDAHPEILELARRVANFVAQTSVLGRWAGPDELESEAMVALWNAALGFDPERGLDFESYAASIIKLRLLDWLRLAYGRTPDCTRRRAALAYSLEGSLEGEDFRHNVQDPAPGPEQRVIDRMELDLLFESMASWEPQHVLGLLSPALGNSQEIVAEEHGTTKVRLNNARYWGKVKAYAVLDRPWEKRPYRHREAVGKQVAIT